MRQALCTGLALIFLFSTAAEARRDAAASKPLRTVARPAASTDNPRNTESLAELATLSASETTLLYSATFNSGQICNAQGWTSVDLTAQLGDFWHVDDYAGLSFGPLEGTKSLWCGLRPGTGPAVCQYQTLPGYGNFWNQTWCTKNCLTVTGGATTQLDVSFTLRYDAEMSYDGVALEFTNDCSGDTGWQRIDGGTSPQNGWTGTGTISVSRSYNVGAGPVKVRLRFTSDTAVSDEDGNYNSDGAAHVDNLKVETLAIENFEDESVGATSSNDWQSCNLGFGNYAGLFNGASLLQQDDCKQNLSCIWAFIQGSTDYFTCGGYPTQKVVPYRNDRGQYIQNEIWSPPIPLTGNGQQFNLAFDVYRDNPLDPLIFYTWRVRTIVNGCPTPWRNDNFLFTSDDIGWFRHVQEIGPYVNLAQATQIQVALGVVDACFAWCGIFGSGQCHTNGPMFDNVKLYRVNVGGPLWSVQEQHLFQDTFSSNGTITGAARADVALDIRGQYLPTIAPGDSSVIFSLVDPAYATTSNTSGLSDDPNVSTFIGRNKTKKQVYMWVAVWPQGQPNKSGDGLSEGPGGQANRYPHIAEKDYVDSHGVTWSAIRADYTYLSNATQPGDGTGTSVAHPRVAKRFNVDLNDNLFTPGDTVCFFFGATSPSGTTYYSDQWHVTDNIAEVADNPMEFTILPAGGYNHGGDILYVDGADGLGDQTFWDGAFLVLGLLGRVDRFDVRDPSTATANRLSSRVVNVAAQLNAAYRYILWDTGSLSATLGDGTGVPLKTNDYGMLNTFLGNLQSNGGLYLGGDDLPEMLNEYPGSGAVAFRTTYMPFTLINANHRLAPTAFPISPAIKAWPFRAYSDNFTIFGGCPELNDFDVMGASGSSRVEMSYMTASTANGAVVSRAGVNGNGKVATVVMSGFSLAAIRDDELDGILDRAKFLLDTVRYLGKPWIVEAAGDLPPANSLAQNYPNPFNPQTTIAFSIVQRANAHLAIYDVNGALVRTLANEMRAAGAYTLDWNGRDDSGRAVASGVYFYKLIAGSFVQTRKMVLLK
jgi:FlgD Ig-like domain